jgi:hypothetical protein
LGTTKGSDWEMASFESRHVIHPSKDEAKKWAARVDRPGVKVRSATGGRHVARTASGEASPASSGEISPGTSARQTRGM